MVLDPLWVFKESYFLRKKKDIIKKIPTRKFGPSTVQMQSAKVNILFLGTFIKTLWPVKLVPRNVLEKDKFNVGNGIAQFSI